MNHEVTGKTYLDSLPADLSAKVPVLIGTKVEALCEGGLRWTGLPSFANAMVASQKLCQLHLEICDLSHAWPAEPSGIDPL